MLLDRVVLFDHSHGPPPDLLVNELHLVNHLLNLHHLNHLLLLSHRIIHVLLHRARLPNHAHSWSVLHLLAHDDLDLRLLLFPHDSLYRFHRLKLILDLLLVLELLLERESLNCGLKGAEHLLLPTHCFHLPLGSLPGSVLVLCVNVTVPMTMHGVGKILNSAALGAGPTGAAGSSLGLAPEGTILMVAAASTPRRLATPSALTPLILPL